MQATSQSKFDPTKASKAPAGAFAFDAACCQFAEPTTRDKSGLRKMPIDILARTGKPVYHWYWEWIVHDMAGMRSKSKIALDYRHDPDEPIGYSDKITATNELRLGGELLSRRDDDEAAKIMDLGPAGVPYEASIQFNPATVVLEYLPEGRQTVVNGETVMGPLTIAREWELLRCAICLTGTDGGTETSFSGEGAAQFSLNWKDGSPMTKTADTTPPDNTPPAGAGAGVSASVGEQEAPATPTVSTETKPFDRTAFEQSFRAELKRYTDRFGGEDGTKYFSEGLSYEAALDKHVAKLEAGMKAETARAAAAEEKLAKLDLGETPGVNTGKPNSAAEAGGKKTTFESLHKPAAGTQAV